MKKEDFFGNLKNDYPSDLEIERTTEIIDLFDFENGEQLTKIHCESIILLADIFDKFIKVSIKEIDINPVYCISLTGYNWKCGLKSTGIKLQSLQDKDLILLLENIFRGGISSVRVIDL